MNRYFPFAWFWLCVAAVLTFPTYLTAAPESQSWQEAMNSAEIARQDAHYDEAEGGYRAALAIAEHFGPTDVRLAQTLNELGLTLRMADRVDEAKPYHVRALGIADKLGKSNPEVATSLVGLAAVADYEGHPAEAVADYKRALVLREQLFGKHSVEVGRCLYSFAVFRITHGDLDEARSLLERGVSILAQSSGHSDYFARSLHALAIVYAREGRDSQATAYFNRSVAEGVRSLGTDDHPLIAHFDLDYADYRVSKEDPAGAIPYYNVALSIFARTKDDQGLALCKAGLAGAYARQQRYPDAERMLAEAIPVLEKSKRQDPEYLQSLVTLRDQLPNHSTGSSPTYDTRYVNGTMFQVGTQGDVQVWLAAWKGKDLQTMVYIVNGSEHPFTFFPGNIRVAALHQGSGGTEPEQIQTFTAEEYERKVQNRNMWRAIAAGMATVGNTPQPQTTNVSGQYEVRDQGATTYGSFYGSITRWPTQADYEAANERNRARLEAMTSQLQASFQAISSSLMRNQTLDPHTYYGGNVFMRTKGKNYLITIPVEGSDFQFTVSFPR